MAENAAGILLPRRLLKYYSMTLACWTAVSSFLILLIVVDSCSSPSCGFPVSTTTAAKSCSDTLRSPWFESSIEETSLPKSTRRLWVQHEGGITEIFLCGTAHVSSRSCEEVSTLIRTVRPNVVLLELCTQRLGMLAGYDDTRLNGEEHGQEEKLRQERIRRPDSLHEKDDQGSKISVENIRKMGFVGAVMLWMQSKSAQAMGSLPGAEFRCALREARSLSKPALGNGDTDIFNNNTRSGDESCQVLLCDRPCAVTLRRLFESLGFWQRVRLVGSVLWTGILMSPKKLQRWLNKQLDDSETITEEILRLGKAFPSVVTTLIAERDAFMVQRLLECVAVCRPRRIVFVLGAGHVSGVADYWQQIVHGASSSTPTGEEHQQPEGRHHGSNLSIEPLGDYSRSRKQREEYSTLPVCVTDSMINLATGDSDALSNESHGEKGTAHHANRGGSSPLRFAVGERVLLWNEERLPQRAQVVKQWFDLSTLEQSLQLQKRQQDEEAETVDTGSTTSEPHAYLVVSKAGYIAVPFDDDTVISQDLFLSSVPAEAMQNSEAKLDEIARSIGQRRAENSA